MIMRQRRLNFCAAIVLAANCLSAQASARITMDGEDHHGLALKITAPPGFRNPGFVGIAFRVRPDASHYELFYLRPGLAQNLKNGSDVAGSWRNGYVELSFSGEWPKDSRQGAPGPVNAFLTGWLDGDSAQGRMRVEARSDGTWAAVRMQ
jgi:hypothetical protein